MSSRRVRVVKRMVPQLLEIEEALAHVGAMVLPELEAARARSLRCLRWFVLPRLSEEVLPLVVSLVGPTGSGKSTIFNTIAGQPISRVSVLRPTTSQPVVWATPHHAPGLAQLGKVVADDHPLAHAVALVDTPDLDSDSYEHRNIALEMALASDVVVLVTTAARYGDAAPWEALAEIPWRRMAVVLNRLPRRSSGARQDLNHYLRQRYRAQIPVMTVSEQSTVGDQLRPQAVQRLSAQLRSWANEAALIRREAFASTSGQLACDLRALAAHLRQRRSDFEALKAASHRRHREEAKGVLELVERKRRPWWRRASEPSAIPASQVLEALDRAARCSFQEGGVLGIELESDRQLVPSEIVTLIESQSGWPEEAIPEVFEDAARAWANGLASGHKDIAGLLEQGAALLAEYPDGEDLD